MNKNLKIKLLCSLIIVIICITIVIIIKLNNSKTCAVELSKNSSLSTEMIEKIAKITKSEEKVAYLTFDDGPSCNTKRVLDVLNAYQINATFFLIGSNITPDTKPIVERMVKEGNAVGIHTYSHEANKMYASAEAFEKDFLQAEDIINATTGQKARLCRFPWGSANNYLKKIDSQVLPWLEEKGYYYCDWNVSAEDSIGTPTAYSIIRNIKKDYGRYEHPILLMHDSNTNCLTAEMLPDIIVMLKQDGYNFDTLDHMEKPYQYARN